MWYVSPLIPSLRGLRQKYPEFEVNLGSIARLNEEMKVSIHSADIVYVLVIPVLIYYLTAVAARHDVYSLAGSFMPGLSIEAHKD